MCAAKKRKGISAWLVTWEHIGDHAKPDQEVETIYNPRWSSRRIQELTELSYASKSYSIAEQINIAKTRRNNPYPASVTDRGHIICGHNPWLHARKVKNLLVTTGPNGEESVTWDEWPLPIDYNVQRPDHSTTP